MSQSCLGASLVLLLDITFCEIFKTSSDGKRERKMNGSAHANRTATRQNELQTFLAGTTHAQGHLTFAQQVMQMPSVQANSYNFSEVKKKVKNLADSASQRKV